VLPLVLALRSTQISVLFSSNRWLVTIGTLAAAIAVITAIFATSQYPLIFVLYPLLMLVDWLLGLFGSSIALCCACVLASFSPSMGTVHSPTPRRWVFRATWRFSSTWVSI